MKKYKGQTFSFELLVIVPLFFLIFLIFLNTYENLPIEEKNKDMLLKGITVLDNLIESPGYPVDWNYENVERIGLCYDRGKIDSNKLKEFIKINETTLYNSLNTGKYNLFINLQYPNRTVFSVLDNETKIGNPSYGEETSEVIFLREYVVYENEKLILEVVLWD